MKSIIILIISFSFVSSETKLCNNAEWTDLFPAPKFVVENWRTNFKQSDSDLVNEGTCPDDRQKWIFDVSDSISMKKGCVCLKIDTSEADVGECLVIPRSQTAKRFVSNELRDVPSNGNCPEGTYKFILTENYYKFYGTTYEKDTCHCLPCSDYAYPEGAEADCIKRKWL